MLARHAEDLFWAGRYLERAQGTARILDVLYHSSLSSPGLGDETWYDLLEVLLATEDYRARHLAVDPQLVHDFLVLDLEHPDSVSALIRRSRENLRRVRELLSSELWEAVNDGYLRLGARDLRRDLEQHPAQLYGFVTQLVQGVLGVANETLPRDEGWHFFQLGVRLERTGMSCRLVDVLSREVLRAGDPSGIGAWTPLLRAAAASEAFLRAGASPEPEAVLGFLLLSPTFPRSVLFSVFEAERRVTAVSAPAEMSPPRRLLGRLRAQLEFCDIRDVMAEGLSAFLGSVARDAHGAADAVAARFFHRPVDAGIQLLEVRSVATPEGAHPRDPEGVHG